MINSGAIIIGIFMFLFAVCVGLEIYNKLWRDDDMADIRRKHEMRNYDFCYGAGVNWYDLEKGLMYHIQEYKEAIEKGEKPKGIRVSLGGDINRTVEWVDPYILKERMKDPEPDPRY